MKHQQLSARQAKSLPAGKHCDGIAIGLLRFLLTSTAQPSFMRFEKINCEVEVPLQRPTNITYGVRVSQHTITPQIDILSIDKNDTGFFQQNSITVCESILGFLELDTRLDKYSWTYSRCPVRSAFSFYTHQGYPVILTIENQAVLSPHTFPQSIVDFERDFHDPEGIAVALSRGLPETNKIQKRNCSYIVAQTPNRKQRMHVYEETKFRDEKHSVVLFDTNRLYEYWQSQAKLGISLEQNDIDRYDWELLNSRTRSFNFSIDPEIGTLGSIIDGRKINFINGRHRTANMIFSGSWYVPIRVQNRDAEEFRKDFAWHSVEITTQMPT